MGVIEFKDKKISEMSNQELNAREAHLKDHFRDLEKEKNEVNDMILDIKIERSKRGAND